MKARRDTIGRYLGHSDRLQMLRNLRQLAKRYHLTDDQLNTLTLHVAGDVASNASTAGLHLTTIQLVALDADKARAWAAEIEAMKHDPPPAPD